MKHYDPDLRVRLACDSYGLGAVILHVMENGKEMPIAFASRSLNSAEKVCAQIHKEALAIIWGEKKFHCYLSGRKFTLVTNHQPLLTMFGPKKGVPATTEARLQRYAFFCKDMNTKSSTKTQNPTLTQTHFHVCHVQK